MLLYFIPFFDEIPLSKQDSPRWDAANCGVTSGAIYCLPVSHKKDVRLIRVKFALAYRYKYKIGIARLLELLLY